MSKRDLVLQQHRESILDAVRRHRGNAISLFGSVARGDDSPSSDFDFLVDFSTDSSLFDLMRLQEELESLLGSSVDVVSVGGLKPRDSHILNEAIPLDAQRNSTTQ